MLGFILLYKMDDFKNLHVKCILGTFVAGEDTLENKEEQPQAMLKGSLLQNLKSSTFVVLWGPVRVMFIPLSYNC